MARTILLLTCRDPATDFRRPLAQALAALGHKVFYLWLKRRPLLTEIGTNTTHELSPWDTLAFALSLRREPDLLVFNSTNLAHPSVSALLRIVIGGQWCFDLHDDLLYATTGWRRLRARAAQFVLLKTSDFAVYAAPTLASQFPASHQLGNASDQQPIHRAGPDVTQILILASIDERFDFALLSDQARRNPGLRFDIWGHVSKAAPGARSKLTALLASSPNVNAFGPYDSASLPAILANYSIAFAPYLTPAALTDTIDPLRYYHCLNAGLEVITTPIPRAHDLADLLHLLAPGDDIGPLAKQLAAGKARRNPGTTATQFNWTIKAQRLLDIAEAAR